MKRLANLTFQFYRLLLLYNIAITVLFAFLLGFSTGSFDLTMLFFAKLVGFGCAVALHYFSAKETYFYFRNAGSGITRLILFAFTIDATACMLIITLLKIILYVATNTKS